MDTPQKFIMDLEMLNTWNEKGCIACGKKFSLGDTVVPACGAWEGGAKIIHKNEAIFDKKTGGYVERNCYAAGRSTHRLSDNGFDKARGSTIE